jgi:hypothetical protein
VCFTSSGSSRGRGVDGSRVYRFPAPGPAAQPYLGARSVRAGDAPAHVQAGAGFRVTEAAERYSAVGSMGSSAATAEEHELARHHWCRKRQSCNSPMSSR